uniref:MDM2 binding protein n=1 Tax=Echeneis naucrates TaxID=173247 RepID=A0A665SXL7_ECHNA
MDRYVLVISFGQTEAVVAENYTCEFEANTKMLMLAQLTCSLSGSPSAQRWYFAVQASQGVTQFCSLDWEELGNCHQKPDSEEEKPNAVESCLISLSNQETAEPNADQLLEEAAEGLHLLSDKLPPPGKALLDVLVLGSAEQSPPIKELLPVLGALKHMSCWHSAKINFVTQHMTGWQKAASYLSAGLLEPADLDTCINHKEIWRGGLVIRERKVRISENAVSIRGCWDCWSFCIIHFVFFFLVCHYYAAVLDLIQVVDLSDLPSFLMSSIHFELFLLQVGVLFSLSCIVTPIAQPAATQLSSQRWRETMSRRPKSLTVPYVEVKGESAHYFLLVQGSDDVGIEACRVRMLHSYSQINGAAAMATVTRLLREKSSSSGKLCCQVCRDVCISVFKTTASTSIPINDLKAILSLAREQYLKMTDSTQPSASTCLTYEQESFQTTSHQSSDWPERSVLHNIENLQRRRQRRFGLLGPGSSDSLLGPKDSQKGSSALLDAKELLKHFTSDGLPIGELQPLTINRGNNVFQLSPDLSPGRITQLPFSKASASHYHGIDFCLDNQRSLDRDQAFVRLQSRLVRHETQTTCSKEPCPLPFALSPAPSPAVMSEPGSVPDGETLQNADVARLKRRSWDTDINGGYPRKRLVKSESSDSLCSQSSGSSGTHPTIRSLRQQPSRSQSTAASISSSSSSATKQTSSVVKSLKHHGITTEHDCFEACSKRLFDISKFYLKDLKTSRGLHDEMKKAASSNVKQVMVWTVAK